MFGNPKQSINLSADERKVLSKLLGQLAGKQEEEHSENLTGLHCDGCEKEIEEHEEYFVSEASFAWIKLEDGKRVENKLKAWQTKLLCMNCYRDADCEGWGNSGADGEGSRVKNYKREVNQPKSDASGI